MSKYSKLNIVFVLPSLAAGGAERVMSLIANTINENDFKATLVIVGYEKDKAYNVDGLNIVYLNKPRVSTAIVRLFKFLHYTKPEVVISCMSHLNTTLAILLLYFPKIILICREANIKKITAIYNKSKIPLYERILKKIADKRTNAIICQSKDMAEELILEHKSLESKITIINNPISDEFKPALNRKQNTITTYITVGRLHEEKGHLRLLDVLAQINEPFKYFIIGSGSWKNNITNHIKKLDLTPFVELIEYTNKIPDYLKISNVFLQGSFAEGFPNALLESCAVGTPAVAFQADGGTKEIIKNGINGYIAKDEKEFLLHLNKLNTNPINPKTVSDSVSNKFSKEKITRQYEMLILKTLKNNH